jgi:hypothetical protein
MAIVSLRNVYPGDQDQSTTCSCFRHVQDFMERLTALCCQKVDCFCWLVEPEKLFGSSLTDVMSKQKFSGWLRLGSCLWEHHASRLQFVVISLLTTKETNAWVSSAYIVCLVRGPFPSEHLIAHSSRDKCNLCHLHGSCKKLQIFFSSNKHNLCHKILNPRVRPTRQRGLRDTPSTGTRQTNCKKSRLHWF